MQYLGGKSRTRNHIAAYLNRIRKTGQPYWEPFVGAGWVLEKIKGQPIYASDANEALVFMWQRLQQGWVPPSVVTEEMYHTAKGGEYDAALTAFIGFGASHSGKWFAGFIKPDHKINNAVNKKGELWARDSLLKKLNRFEDTHFFAANFLECYVPAYGCLIYCDPPYDDTTAYGAVPPFSTVKFWERVRWLEGHGHTVVVSEYQAPADFSCVVEIVTKTDMHTKNGKDRRVERLFRLGQHKLVQPGLPMLAPHFG
jgi:DNA adenine methylase